VREVGNVVLPPRLRRTSLYRSLVEVGLRFMIEEVGQVEGSMLPRTSSPASLCCATPRAMESRGPAF